MDSQNGLNITKASNFKENRRNRKIHTKSDRIMETAIKTNHPVDTTMVSMLLYAQKNVKFNISLAQ